MSTYSRLLWLGANARGRWSAIALLAALTLGLAGCERKTDSSEATAEQAKIGILPEISRRPPGSLR